MKTLELLRAQQANRLYPAHGSVVENAHAHLSNYITHRQEREQQVISAIQSRDFPQSIREIVHIVYPSLADNLMKGALNNVTHHISKLMKEKRVVAVSQDTYMMA